MTIENVDHTKIHNLKRVPRQGAESGHTFTFEYEGRKFGPNCHGDWSASTDWRDHTNIRIGWWELDELWLERNA